jgi:hypothetical protein
MMALPVLFLCDLLIREMTLGFPASLVMRKTVQASFANTPQPPLPSAA